MKRIVLQLILLVAVVSTVWGQMTAHLGATDENGNLRYENGNYFALWSDTEVRIDWQAEAKPYVLNGPGEMLSFKGRSRPGGIDNPSIAVREGTLQENSETVEYSDSYIFHQRVVDSYTLYGDYKDIPLTSGQVTHLRFENKKGTLDRWINNIRVTMGKYLFFDFHKETLTHTLTFPTKILNTGAESLSFNFDWANIDDLVITNNTQAFTINTLTEYSQKGAWGTTKLTVTCDYTQAGNFEEYITIYSPTLGQSIVLNLKADVQDKKEQIITWEQNVEGLVVGTTITLAATTNSGLPLTYTSSDPNIASVKDNQLTLHDIGRVELTASNAGDEEWFNVSATKTVVVYNPNQVCDNLINKPNVTLKGGSLSSEADNTEKIEWGAGNQLGHFYCKAYASSAKKLYVDFYKGETKLGEWTKSIARKETITINGSIPADYSTCTHIVLRAEKQFLGADIEVSNIQLTLSPTLSVDASNVSLGTIGYQQSQTGTVNITYSALTTIHRVKWDSNNSSKVFAMVDAWGNPLSEKVFAEACGNNGILPITIRFSSKELTMDDFADTPKNYSATLLIEDKNGVTQKTITVTGTLVQNLPAWLPIIPTATSTTLLPTETEYANMLYWEMDDALRTAVGASGNYATLQSTADITILGSQYMLLSAEADQWRSFVAPMDVEKAYVIELTPEPTANIEDEATRNEMLDKQTAANQAFYSYLKNKLDADDKQDLLTLIDEYLTQLCTANGYTKQSEVGIYELEHYNGTNAWTYTYYLYESAPTWVLNGDGFAKEWTPVAAAGDIMQRGETYAINFPYCLECPDYTGWDYWTGKLILLEHKGEQTIQGQHAASTYTPPVPTTGIAVHAGNAYFADVQSGSLAFMHNAATDTYVATPDTRLRPTASVLYADMPTKQGKRAVAITRQGEIIWEDAATDDDNSGVVTDIDYVAPSTVRVMAQEGGFSVLSSTAQAVHIYGIDGRLVYMGRIGADEAHFFSVTAGMYVVRTQSETQKILAR